MLVIDSPIKACKISNKVERGVWKFVINASTVLIFHPGFIKIFVFPLKGKTFPFLSFELSRILKTVVPTAIIFPPLDLNLLIRFDVLF